MLSVVGAPGTRLVRVAVVSSNAQFSVILVVLHNFPPIITEVDFIYAAIAIPALLLVPCATPSTELARLPRRSRHETSVTRVKTIIGTLGIATHTPS